MLLVIIVRRLSHCHVFSFLLCSRKGIQSVETNTNTAAAAVKVEMQKCGNCYFRFWPHVGGCGPLIDGFGPIVPLLVVAAARLLN